VLSFRRRRPGRILAIKLGLNPNSSSLGVDVTFLLFGAAALSFATPVISALLRFGRKTTDAGGEVFASEPPEDHEDGE
jgi:hypothetical protein